MRKIVVRGARLSLLLVLCALAGCADSSTGPKDADPLLAALAERGLPPELAVDAGDVFVVDGDIIVRKSGLHTGVQPRMQYRTTGVPDAYQYSVNLNALANDANWLAAARGAITQWNAIPGSAVRLVETTGPGNITVQFGTCQGGTAQTVACAEWPAPVQGCWLGSCYTVGPFITLHTGFTGFLTANGRRVAMAHELGHTLGLRHTDWSQVDPPSGAGAVHIPGTPQSSTGMSDDASVMNSTPQGWVTGFSYFDRVAARHLWPGGPGPASTAALEGSHPRVNWPSVLDAVSYDVFFFQVSDCGWMCYGPAPVTSTYVGTTTSTTYLDTSRSFSTSTCYMTQPHSGYQIRVTYKDGKQSALGGHSTYNGSPTCFY